MATLEKIRSKSVLLFTVIIVALLAFILGDLFTSGRSLFGGDTTVGKIGNHEIDIQKYQERLSITSAEAQQSGQEVDPEMLQAKVLQQMFFESMMNEEFDKLGITVTNKELADMLSLNPQTAQLIDAVKNPSKYKLQGDALNQIKANLRSVETEAEQTIKNHVYGYLFSNLFTANELDAKDLYNSINSKYVVSFAAKELASLPDDKFQVSDDEIKAEWEKNKAVYKIENEMRTISFLTVNLDPSNEDKAKVESIVANAVDSLKKCPGVEAVASDVNFAVKTKTYAPSQIKDINLKNFIDSAKVGQVGTLPQLDKTYRIAKLLKSEMAMDSINVTLIAAKDSAAFDSTYAALKGGAAIKDLKKNTNIQVQDSTWVQISHPDITMIVGNDSLVNQIKNSTVGSTIPYQGLIAGQNVNIIYDVNKTTPMVKFSEVAEIEYVAEPSEATINKLTGDPNNFLAKNTTSEAFIKNAPAAGYALEIAKIDATSSHINFKPETRSVIKWALEANIGDVSTPFANRDNNRLIVATVTGAYNDYISYDEPEVKKALTAIVRDNKKAESIIKDWEGKGAKDFASYAQLTGDSIKSANITFASSTVNSLGNNESAFVGKVCGAQKGQFIKPFKTNNAVVVAKVDDITTEGRPYNFKEACSQFNFQNGGRALYNNLFGILKGNNKYESNLLKFYENSK